MEDRLIHIVLFSGFLSVILCNSYDYVLVQELKVWKEARDFCRMHYIDLATIQTEKEWSVINKLRANHGFKTWIDDVNSWRWSSQNECLTYRRWDKNQPDNYGGNQDCVMLHSDGYWRDENCDLKCVVICQSGQGPVLVTDPVMSWKQAQSFCRVNYTDLHTVKNQHENQLLKTRIRNHSCAWIGLYRDSWKRSNQTNIHTVWKPCEKPPDNESVSEICAAVNKSGLITEELCSEKHFFICKAPCGLEDDFNVFQRLSQAQVKRQVLRLEVKAGENVIDEVTSDAVLKEVQMILREQGMAADVKLSWQEQPNGTVFQKLKKQHPRYRLSC